VSLKPAHVSVYDLQIEEGTLFHRWFKAGQEPLPSDDKSAELYCTASRRLREAGFEHYEVSNYAMTGFQCKHNLVYWENQPFYAFGIVSTSYVDGQRLARPRKIKDYASFVESLSTSSRQDLSLDSKLALEDQVLDTVMLSLRLARGLNLTEFQAKFGLSLTATLCNCLVPFVENGLVEALDAERQAISSSLYIHDWKDTKQDISKIVDTVVIGETI
jgi:coproporphyrinogen III oxidase-like Fe-S oxidoreductase